MKMRVILKEWRLRRGYSQAELARRSGVKQPIISDVENGNALNPTVDTVFRLSKALRCAMDDLISEEEPERKAE